MIGSLAATLTALALAVATGTAAAQEPAALCPSARDGPTVATDTAPPACDPRPSPSPDPWFSGDKLRHFTLAYGVASFAYAAARIADVGPDAALGTAAATTIAAGLGKELFDRRRGHGFSLKDLVWDVAGLGAGLLVLRHAR